MVLDRWRGRVGSTRPDSESRWGAGTVQEGCGNHIVIHGEGLRADLMGYVCPTAHPIFAAEDRPGAMPLHLDQTDHDLSSRPE